MAAPTRNVLLCAAASLVRGLLFMPTAPTCDLVYIEFGSNIGDSMEDLVYDRPGLAGYGLRKMLLAAWPAWTPGGTCVIGFEPNPRWTSTLRNVSRTLAPLTRCILINTETAVTHEHSGSTLLNLGESGANDVGASIATAPSSKGKSARVATVNLLEYLEAVVHSQPGVPIVMRIDAEGAEYYLLRDLAAIRRVQDSPGGPRHNLAHTWP
jgi:hypothetical protein